MSFPSNCFHTAGWMIRTASGL